MKTCFKCNVEKELSEFYKHPKMPDGHLNKCKECNKKDVTENRLKKIDYYKAFDKKRAMLPHRVKAREEYIKTEAGKIAYTKAHKKYDENNPHKKKAVQAVNNYIRYNPDFKKPCVICGLKAQAHHHDYTKPLDVIWLCSKHHSEEHKRLRLENKDPDKPA